MGEKAAKNISIIGGADGPTSIFLVGRQERTGKQKLRGYLYGLRKSWIEKHIKAQPHSMSELENYLKEVHGFTEVDRNTEEYQSEYMQMRASFIIQYAKELLGEYASPPELTSQDAEGVKKFMEQIELRLKAAENIPKEMFDIDLHIFGKNKNETETGMKIIVESKYQYIGGSFSSSNSREMRECEKIYRNIYRYYGVSKEDIEQKSRRYKELVKTLARR